MGALGADGLDGAGGIDQQDLGAVEAVDLDLVLLAHGKRQRLDAQ